MEVTVVDDKVRHWWSQYPCILGVSAGWQVELMMPVAMCALALPVLVTYATAIASLLVVLVLVLVVWIRTMAVLR
jgi:hypothetical protein